MNDQSNIYEQVLTLAKEHEKELTKERCNRRIDKFIDTINFQIQKQKDIGTFTVCTSDRKQMIQAVLTQISIWNGGKNYTKYKNAKDCHTNVVRAWWNRVKCWKLGDYVLGPLIKLLFKFIIGLQINGINETMKSKIFIDLLMTLLQTKIKYPKSMARPLIPIQIFVKKNQFRDFCEKFASDYGEKWQSNGINRYLPNPKRSDQLFTSYLNCLKLILNKIEINMVSMDIETDTSSPSTEDNNENITDNINININDNNTNDSYLYIHPNNNPLIPPFPHLNINNQTFYTHQNYQRQETIQNYHRQLITQTQNLSVPNININNNNLPRNITNTNHYNSQQCQICPASTNNYVNNVNCCEYQCVDCNNINNNNNMNNNNNNNGNTHLSYTPLSNNSNAQCFSYNRTYINNHSLNEMNEYNCHLCTCDQGNINQLL